VNPTTPRAATAGVLCSLLLWFPLHAQEAGGLGVALGGGGAKGLAHIGVLKVLEAENVPVTAVAGTSMGSIVGGLYAMGLTAAQVESIAYSINWAEIFADSPDRTLMALDQRRWEQRYIARLGYRDGHIVMPSGLITGQNVGLALATATLPAHGTRDFLALPRPFLCVATNLEDGAARVLSSGDLGDAIRASMAIPTVFTPVILDSVVLVDGGVVRNLPAQDARALGARVVLAVDVSAPLQSRERLTAFTDVMNQTMAIAMTPSAELQRNLADIVVRPDVGGTSVLDFSNIAGTIAAGETAAREALPRIRALVDSLGLRGAASPEPVVFGDSLDIDTVEVAGLRALGGGTVLLSMNLSVPGRVPRSAVENGIHRVYSSGLFTEVDYRCVEEGGLRRLRVRVQEKDQTLVQLGVRYDTQNGAGILGGVRFANVGQDAGYLNMDFQIGERIEADLEFVQPLDLFQGAGLALRIDGSDDREDLFQGGERTASATVRSVYGALSIGSLFSRLVAAGVGVRAEYSYTRSEVSAIPLLEKYWAGALLAFVHADTRDRKYYPRTGSLMTARADLNFKDFTSS
jgi:NTE family protein